MSTNYDVDIVMCIDKTGSMSPVIEGVKANALKFDSDLRGKLESKQKELGQLRVRVIAFGDCYADGDSWVRSSDFMDLPGSSDRFKEFVSKVSPEGGGDEPENALEAIAMAIKSKWTSGGFKRRHVIVVWTDASAHPLEVAKDKSVPHYPADLPRSFDELKDLWDSQAISASARRLVIFAPEAYPWGDIATHWDEAIHFPSQAGAGLGDVDYQTILDTLANSI
jgi:hypothetical protein